MAESYDTPLSCDIDTVIESIIIAGMETKELSINRTAGQTAVELLRIHANAAKITNVELAERLGVNRVTVAYRFNKGIMSLDDYVDTANAIGADPLETLARAIRLHESAPAPAAPTPGREGSR